MKYADAPVVNRDKKTYMTPMLRYYGKVSALTQSGTSGPNESSGKPGMTQSDRFLKSNIVKVGVHPLGIGLYLFDYKPEFRDAAGRTRQFGVMADEVEQVMPEAVSVHPDGYRMVNYAMLGISRNLH